MNSYQLTETTTTNTLPTFEIFNNIAITPVDHNYYNNTHLQPPTTPTDNTTNNQQTNIANSNISSMIKIATHNIQGLNNITKQQLWAEYCHNNNYDIISITETKLSENTWQNQSLNNSAYLFYTSNNNLTPNTCIQQSSL